MAAFRSESRDTERKGVARFARGEIQLEDAVRDDLTPTGGCALGLGQEQIEQLQGGIPLLGLAEHVGQGAERILEPVRLELALRVQQPDGFGKGQDLLADFAFCH